MGKKRVVLLLFLGLIVLAYFQKPDDNFHLVFCDIGEGDAVLITYRSNQILIDGGPDNSVLNCLANNVPFWDREIELVIMTHPDADHYAGFLEVLPRYRVQKFITTPVGKKDDLLFKSLISLLIDQKIETQFLAQFDKIKVGLIEIDIVWPSKTKLKELESVKTISEETENGFLLVDGSLVDANEFSLGTRIKMSEFDTLLLGDLPGDYAQKLVWQNKLPQVEVLKASHHGAKGDNPEELYLAVKPKLVVISVGENSFGHPGKELLEILKRLGIKAKRTDEDGEVEIVSDGQSWWLD